MNLEDLDALEWAILNIAEAIGEGKTPITIKVLYKAVVSQLDYPEDVLIQAIHKLFQKKYLVEGLELTKISLLEDKKRRSIIEYVKKNPGAHIREIQRAFNLGTYDTLRNLKYLEIFGYFRNKRFMNKVTYFLKDTNETQDEKILILKNVRTKLVFDQIRVHKKIRLFEIGNNLNLNHGQIQPHIKKLLDYDLIYSKQKDHIIYYYPKIPEIPEVIQNVKTKLLEELKKSN